MVPSSLQCSHACIPALCSILHCHQHTGMQERHRPVVTWFPHWMQWHGLCWHIEFPWGFVLWPPSQTWHKLMSVSSPFFFLRGKLDLKCIITVSQSPWLPEASQLQGSMAVLFLLPSASAPRSWCSTQIGVLCKDSFLVTFSSFVRLPWSHRCCRIHSLTQIFLGFPTQFPRPYSQNFGLNLSAFFRTVQWNAISTYLPSWEAHCRA